MVLVTLPRSIFDGVTDFSSLERSSPTLFAGWGDGVHVSNVVGFAEPPKLIWIPPDGLDLPPPVWDERPLPVSLVLLALTVTRCSPDSPKPTYHREGSQPTLAEIRAAERANNKSCREAGTWEQGRNVLEERTVRRRRPKLTTAKTTLHQQRLWSQCKLPLLHLPARALQALPTD